MDTMNKHWTSSTIDNFVFQIAADFTLQLEKKLEVGPISNKELAERLKVSAGRVSQVLNNPGNFKLRSMTEYARALGMKITVVAYDDNDPENKTGPINSEVFYECWKRVGRPRDFYDLRQHLIVQAIDYGFGPSPVAMNDEQQDYRINILQSAGTRSTSWVQ
jgi:transcriptional regulator with XRE-family HTH domain